MTPLRIRHDGWNPARQALFLDTLAKTGCVRDAARVAGLSATSAYRLRRRRPDFAADWKQALEQARVPLEAVAWKRAVKGVEEPVFHAGREVGTRRRYSDSLLKLLIQRGDLAAQREAERAAAARPSEEQQSEAMLQHEEERREVAQAAIEQARADLFQAHRRMHEHGWRRINIQTLEGVDSEVIAAVSRPGAAADAARATREGERGPYFYPQSESVLTKLADMLGFQRGL